VEGIGRGRIEDARFARGRIWGQRRRWRRQLRRSPHQRPPSFPYASCIRESPGGPGLHLIRGCPPRTLWNERMEIRDSGAALGARLGKTRAWLAQPRPCSLTVPDKLQEQKQSSTPFHPALISAPNTLGMGARSESDGVAVSLQPDRSQRQVLAISTRRCKNMRCSGCDGLEEQALAAQQRQHCHRHRHPRRPSAQAPSKLIWSLQVFRRPVAVANCSK
jgi:hypothetical protein